MSTPTVDTDVLVVGAGPCGITLANLLGGYSVRTLVIDRETQIIDFPRAVGIDDESLRTCQTVGAVHAVLHDCVQNTPIRYHTSWGRCEVELASVLGRDLRGPGCTMADVLAATDHVVPDDIEGMMRDLAVFSPWLEQHVVPVVDIDVSRRARDAAAAIRRSALADA